MYFELPDLFFEVTCTELRFAFDVVQFHHLLSSISVFVYSNLIIT